MRHGRHDSPRTGGRQIDRRRACEETAEGRFHLQVRPFTQSRCADVPGFGACFGGPADGAD
jgi:hypothetical protein